MPAAVRADEAQMRCGLAPLMPLEMQSPPDEPAGSEPTLGYRARRPSASRAVAVGRTCRELRAGSAHLPLKTHCPS